MRQEGISTSPGGGGMWHRLFRLPRMAIAVVVMAVAVAVAVVAVVTGPAQAQTTTTLSLAYNDNGDTIAVPGKLGTATVSGHKVAHDDSRAYFKFTRSGGGSLFSDEYDGVVASLIYSYANGFGSPSSSDRGVVNGISWNMSEVIAMANAGPPTYAKTTGPLTITLVEKEGEPYTVGTNHSICIVLHDLNGNVTGDNCQSGS